MREKALPSIGFVGAGLSALSAAGVLRRAGFSARLFEKSRDPGGRMATWAQGSYAFDYGAQYFTARDSHFRQQVEGWITAGKAQLWEGRIGRLQEGHFQLQEQVQERFVGVPRMSSIGCYLAADLEVDYARAIEQIEGSGKSWALRSRKDLFRCDIAVVSTPPRQALDLLPPDSSLGAVVSQVDLSPCWALMVAFEDSLALPFDGAFVAGAPLSWVARNSSKPGRSGAECWVLHAAPDWSRAHLDMETGLLTELMLDAFFQAAGSAPVTPLFTTAHCWRYSIAQSPLARGSLWDAEERIGLCGDWCNSLRVEGAFLSGIDLANRIVDFATGS